MSYIIDRYPDATPNLVRGLLVQSARTHGSVVVGGSFALSALFISADGSSARARLLLDSLTEVEREREAFGTTGGADPVYVALTSRAAEIGRAIQAVGQSRRY